MSILEQVEKDTAKHIRKLAMKALASLILKSPVDTGRFKSNWIVSINNPSLEYDENNMGQMAFEAGVPVINTAKPTDSIHITNNLPYAQVLEDGSSMQAPQGIVAITVKELS